MAHRLWYSYLTGDLSQLDARVKLVRQIFRHLPTEPRCTVCRAPFSGIGGAAVSLFGFGAGRSHFSPRLCDRCEKIVKKHQVGTELQLTLLFADVRGSTPLAEAIGPSAFHHLIDRFYKACTDVLVNSDALIDRLIGDQVIGLYVPGEDTCRLAEVSFEDCDSRTLNLKGRSEPIDVRVIRVSPGATL